MCISYQAPQPQTVSVQFDTPIDPNLSWPEEIWQDYAAPIITAGDASGKRRLIVGSYGMVPKRHMGKKRISTMNARSETVGELKTFATPWRNSQRCLVPLTHFYEPNWETKKHVRWAIGLADDEPFAVAGIWRTWEELNGVTAFSFTQLTVNADDHPVMNRFHQPEDEKRSLIILPKDDWQDWLDCDPEKARSFFRLYPAELMLAAPVQPSKTAEDSNLSLF